MAEFEQVAENVWIADGPTVSFYGFPYPTRMAVVALEEATGTGLWIWSPIELDKSLGSQVEELGEVRWLVAPNKLHHLFLDEWCEAYTEAKLYGTKEVVQKRDDLDFSGQFTDEFEAPWSTEIDCTVFQGSFLMEEAVFFHGLSKTLFVTDLIQRHDPDDLPALRGWLMNLDGVVGEDGSTPKEWRFSFWDREQARQAYEEVCSWNIENLIIAHGDCAFGNGNKVFRHGLDWLKGDTDLS